MVTYFRLRSYKYVQWVTFPENAEEFNTIGIFKTLLDYFYKLSILSTNLLLFE